MPVRDFVAATSVGIVDGEPLLDLAYEEDSRADVDMNIVQTGDGRFIEVQGTAEAAPFGRDALLVAARSRAGGHPPAERPAAGDRRAAAVTTLRAGDDQRRQAARNPRRARRPRPSRSGRWPTIPPSRSPRRPGARSRRTPAPRRSTTRRRPARWSSPRTRASRSTRSTARPASTRRGSAASEAPDLSREVRADLPDARRARRAREHRAVSCARWRSRGRARSSSRRAARSRAASPSPPRGSGGFGYDPIFFYPAVRLHAGRGARRAEVVGQPPRPGVPEAQGLPAGSGPSSEARGSSRLSRRPELRPMLAADVRLDVWLDVACLFKTRSEAQKACNGGKVEVNGQPGKPHRQLHVGDELRITRPPGRRQVVVVTALAEHARPEGRGAHALRGPDAAADARGDRAAGDSPGPSASRSARARCGRPTSASAARSGR